MRSSLKATMTIGLPYILIVWLTASSIAPSLGCLFLAVLGFISTASSSGRYSTNQVVSQHHRQRVEKSQPGLAKKLYIIFMTDLTRCTRPIGKNVDSQSRYTGFQPYRV